MKIDEFRYDFEVSFTSCVIALEVSIHKKGPFGYNHYAEVDILLKYKKAWRYVGGILIIIEE